MTALHELLLSQLKMHFGDAGPPEGMQSFLEDVSHAYGQYSVDVETMARSMQLLSDELIKMNQGLEQRIKAMAEVEQALRESETRLAKAHQVARLGSWVWDIASGQLTWSPEVFSIFGVHPVTYQPTLESFKAAVHPRDRDLVEQSIKRSFDHGTPYDIDHRIVLPDGSERYLNEQAELEYDEAGNVIRMFGTVQDITARKQVERALQHEKAEQELLIHKLEEAQNQLLQSEKLASIGQLAAGVAHEINNPIGFVQSNFGTLGTYVDDLLALIEACKTVHDSRGNGTPDWTEVDRLIKKIDLPFLIEDLPVLIRESNEGIARVRTIVENLKDFSRLDSLPDWQVVDIRKGLQSTLNIVHNEIKYKADVVLVLDPIPDIECLPSHLNQVFLNLLVNAGQAIEEGQHGKITVRTGQRGPNSVFVEVTDTGAGIPDEFRHKIFDPFFTTKPVGKGTGLGLSLSYNIIQKHNGHFELETAVGKGTTFRVVLPISQTPFQPTQSHPPAQERKS